ncbi:hypothetical protein BH09ACT5_BH09ACT5_23120 [soil metagenome]
MATEEVANYWAWLGPEQRRQLPPIQRVAFTTTDNWATMQVTCLRAAGLPAREVNGGFAIDNTGALTQDEAVTAQMTCMAEYPVDPRSRGYLSDAQLLYVYDYFVSRLAPCLEMLGYDVPRPPDRYAYIGTVRSGFTWSPYRLEHGPLQATSATWAVINAKCPPLPEEPFGGFQPPVSG